MDFPWVTHGFSMGNPWIFHWPTGDPSVAPVALLAPHLSGVQEHFAGAQAAGGHTTDLVELGGDGGFME
jgi:hypothetical protein